MCIYIIIEYWLEHSFKGAVMRIEKALINDRLCVSKVS